MAVEENLRGIGVLVRAGYSSIQGIYVWVRVRLFTRMKRRQAPDDKRVRQAL
jgi:hypothetical protein